MSKISIIVPVYNDEEFLKNCLDSIVKQTVNDIEIICIDDASTDASLEILYEYKNNYNNIKIISYEENKSASQARKDGVFASSGEYIMFVDADDSLEVDACERLYDIINEKNVDILQFGTNVINIGNVSESRVKSMERFLNVEEQRIENDEYNSKEVFESCFVKEKFKFSLWNKIYNAKIVKMAFENIKDGYLPKAQDLYAFFLIAYFAQSYEGISDKFYNYSYGAGITGSGNMDIESFLRFCHQAYIPEMIKTFLQEQEVYEKYKNLYISLYNNLLSECVFNWFSSLNSGKKSEGYDLLIEFWGLENVVSKIEEKYYYERGKVAKYIQNSKNIAVTNLQIKTIATYYHRVANGGVQRVISHLIPIWQSCGYDVVLITDEEPNEDDYYIPENVERVVISNCFDIKQGNYLDRAKDWNKIIEKYKIDEVILHTFISPILLWDLCMIKGNGVAAVVSTHSSFSFPLVSGNQHTFLQLTDVYKVCDVLTALSRTDEKYYKLNGINAVYVPNPVIIEKDQKVSKLNNNNILWVGRFSKEKNPVEAIKIIKKVNETIPDIKLLMVGKGEENIMETVKKEIVENHLERVVELCGFHKDVTPFYKNSSIFLSTSMYEGFPITVAEYQSFGLPAVMYSMPYLEMVRESNGTVQVEQGNINMAAECIINILLDNNLKNQMGKESRITAEKFAMYDYRSVWQKIICLENIQKDISCKDEETEKILINTLLEHWSKGIEIFKENVQREYKKNSDIGLAFWKNEKYKTENYLNSRIEFWKNEKQKSVKFLTEQKEKEIEYRIQQEVNKVKGSITFKIGRIFTFIPGKIKSLVMYLKAKNN